MNHSANMHLRAPLPADLIDAVRAFTRGDIDAAIVLGSGLGGFAETVEIIDERATA